MAKMNDSLDLRVLVTFTSTAVEMLTGRRCNSVSHIFPIKTTN